MTDSVPDKPTDAVLPPQIVPPLETLQVCRAEVTALREHQNQLIANYNTRAGFLIAASGVVIALRITDHPSLLVVLGQGGAALAAALAAVSLVYQATESLSVERYVEYAEEGLPDREILGHVIASEEVNQLLNGEKILRKRFFLALASLAFVVSLGFVVASTVDAYTDGSGPDGPSPTSSVSPSTGSRTYRQCHRQQARTPGGQEENAQTNSGCTDPGCECRATE
ncbi:hypothetical protein SAMN05216489_04015 [Streptomyces sp. 3213]|uniref:hypothetical protein n=1 Tax=Streptomyces sp. 3213.3 TaxID=1855348 RepID=UPI000899F7AC|nr:hypothetical protein [Streptomyces sp. 3213.3]SED64955.1 hypothetical protein SAMN05216489_04015 [Streptomyces sp. 3213] [Streptomyces sp. 3213.3]